MVADRKNWSVDQKGINVLVIEMHNAVNDLYTQKMIEIF